MIDKLIGKQVEVVTGDIVYRGVLVEIGETEIHLRSDEGWITVPVDRVIDVTAIVDRVK